MLFSFYVLKMKVYRKSKYNDMKLCNVNFLHLLNQDLVCLTLKLFLGISASVLTIGSHMSTNKEICFMWM